MSRAQTLAIPSITVVSAVGSEVGPALLARATSLPQRALIRNTGPSIVLLSYVAQAVSDLTSVQDAYRLVPGVADVFVLEINDSIYAVSLGNDGQISVTVSPAFPLGHQWGGS